MVGTMYGTRAKGTRYLEMTEGYVVQIALDKDDQVCGYQFLSLGKMMDAIKKGMSPNEAYEKNLGTYGRFKAEDGAVKWMPHASAAACPGQVWIQKLRRGEGVHQRQGR